MTTGINSRYPVIAIRSKRELAKRLSDRRFATEKATSLIDDVKK